MSSRAVQTTTNSATTLNQTPKNRSPLDTKSIRSFEHSRQRHLHPQDRQDKRFRKYRKDVGNSVGTYNREGRFNGARFLAPIGTPQKEVSDEDAGMDDAEREVWRVIYEDDEDTVKSVDASVPRTFEVDFNDLIRPRRAKKGIANDYELIPRVRNVMVIEDHDRASQPPFGFDDSLDWEVLSELGERETYASVVTR